MKLAQIKSLVPVENRREKHEVMMEKILHLQKKKSKKALEAHLEALNKRMVFGDKFFKHIKKCTIDYRGHFGGKVHPDVLDHLFPSYAICAMDAQLIADLERSMETGKPLKRFVPFYQSFHDCYVCGEKVQWETNGLQARITSKCHCPKKVDAYLNVPSGKMVVANDLRWLFPILGDYNVNQTIGCIKTFKKYEEVGMMHGSVGNTCPAVYKNLNKGKDFRPMASYLSHDFLIATKAPKGHRRVAGICTDLWWYSIVDRDEYLKRLGKLDRKDNTALDQSDQSDYTVVDCEPGLYKFTHDHGADRDAAGVVFCTIKRVGKPLKVKDLEASYRDLNFTAGQIIIDKIVNWPTLYALGNDPVDWIQRAADHCLCVNGNGEEVHPNGFLGNNPDLKMDAPDIDGGIPQFKKRYHWYDLSDWSFLATMAGKGSSIYAKDAAGVKFNKSFVQLAMNICQNVVRYGNQSFDRGNQQTAEQKADHEKKQQELAMQWLRQLDAKYPEYTPKYCKDLLK